MFMKIKKINRILTSIAVFFIFQSNFSYSQTIGQEQFQTISHSVGVSLKNHRSILDNPAQLSKFDSLMISFSYSPSKFGMPELSPSLVCASAKINEMFNSGVSASMLGNSLYNELSFALHSSANFGNSYIIGVSLEYSRINIKNYSKDDLLEIDIGGIVNISKDFNAGFALRNLTRAYYSGGEKTVKQTALIGLGYKLTENLFFDIDAVVSLNHSSGIALSSCYQPFDFMSGRLSFQTNPQQAEFEFLLSPLVHLNISVLFNYNSILGLSKQISACFIL